MGIGGLYGEIDLGYAGASGVSDENLERALECLKDMMREGKVFWKLDRTMMGDLGGTIS